jgi:hypothetical protein
MVQTNQISVFVKDFFLLKNCILKGRGLVSRKQDGTNKPDAAVVRGGRGVRSLDADGVAEDVGLLGGRDLAVGFWSFAGKVNRL